MRPTDKPARAGPLPRHVKIACHNGPHKPGVSCRWCTGGDCLCRNWAVMGLFQLRTRQIQIDHGEHYNIDGRKCTPQKGA